MIGLLTDLQMAIEAFFAGESLATGWLHTGKLACVSGPAQIHVRTAAISGAEDLGTEGTFVPKHSSTFLHNNTLPVLLLRTRLEEQHMSFVSLFPLVSAESGQGVTSQVAAWGGTADAGSALSRVGAEHVIQHSGTATKALCALGHRTEHAFLSRVNDRVKNRNDRCGRRHRKQVIAREYKV